MLPEDSSDAEVIATVRSLMVEYMALKRRSIVESLNIGKELEQARKEIADLAAELRALKDA